MGGNPCCTQSLPCIRFGASRILALGQPLALTKKILEKEPMFQFPIFEIFRKQIYRFLARGLRKLSYGINS
jgi:hypothetical protein